MLTTGYEPAKTELVSVSIDYRRLSPVARFFRVMPTKRKQASVRKPRSDAQRNRERILEVAKEAFTRSGANTSLDDIARDAGVGPGTLYRHFPTREELLGAVYRTEMEKLAQAEEQFAEELPPIEALRAWLLLFVDYIAAKQLIAPARNALLGDPKKVFEAPYADLGSGSRTGETLDQKRRHPDGSRSDRPAAGSIGQCGTGPDWRQSASRLVDILIMGARPVR